MSYVHHTVLVVDSNADDAHFTAFALQRVGVISPVQMVSDAGEAMSYLTGAGSFADPGSCPAPLLVLIDISLPGEAGFEFLAWLRSRPLLKRLPVIVLTSSREPSDIGRAYDLGCNSYLVKPTSFNALLVMMQGLVQYWFGINVYPEHPAETGGELRDEAAGFTAWSRPGEGA